LTFVDGPSKVSTERNATWQVLVDFDGTVAPDDPTDRLFERFADPLWRTIEQEWQDGRISSFECMQRQVELLRVSPEALQNEIDRIRIDAGFHLFLDFCRGRGASVKIVSDGFDRVVGTALATAGITVPFFANTLLWVGRDRWRLAFPHARKDCRVAAANCKCSHAQRGDLPQRGDLRGLVVVGDGRSDFCMSAGADYVIAKGALAEFCRAHGRRYAAFGDFQEATVQLSAWLANVEPVVSSDASTASS
jgi:2,3-diketo-5-methylthio-1-phosphopentane phosphatase